MGAHLTIWLIRRTLFRVLLWRCLCFRRTQQTRVQVSSTNQCHPRASSPCEPHIKHLSLPTPQLSDCRTDPPRLVLIHTSHPACRRAHVVLVPSQPIQGTDPTTVPTLLATLFRPRACALTSWTRTYYVLRVPPPPEIPPPAHACGLGGNGDYDGGESVVAP